MKELLIDVNGKYSSKRLAGFICIVAGLAIGVVSVIMKSGAEYMWPPLITGGGLLGVSIGEKKVNEK